MTILQKINSLTWWNEIAKLRDILLSFNTTTENIDTRLTVIESIPSGDSRPYKVYTALLTQTGTDAPVATVLENTIGGIVIWSRILTGDYLATLTGAFTENKTHLICETLNSLSGWHLSNERVDVDSIRYLSEDETTIIAQDSLLFNASIEIRIYN